jgi:hypothetical protein
LREVIFERGSSLKEIGDFAFYKLRGKIYEIELPEKCERLSGFSLLGIRRISIRNGNRFLAIENCLVTGSNGTELIRYFGDGSRVIVDNRIERISRGCFSLRGPEFTNSVKSFASADVGQSLYELIFEPDSKLQHIEREAFYVSAVRAIRIPSSVEFIGEECFLMCESLCEATFERGSKLQRIEKSAFGRSGLKVIRIPSSVEFIGEKCFRMCESLCEVTFERGSKLQRIEKSTFGLSGLKGIRIPSSVEFIGEKCFLMCNSLCEVIFEGEIKEIGERVFWRCPLRRVMIPHGVQLNCKVPGGCIIESCDPAALSGGVSDMDEV